MNNSKIVSEALRLTTGTLRRGASSPTQHVGQSTQQPSVQAGLLEGIQEDAPVGLDMHSVHACTISVIPFKGQEFTPGIRYYYRFVTPNVAQQYLDNGLPNNRKIKPMQVKSLSQVIEAGRWNPDACPIRFCNIKDRDIMFDGQHRMSAIIMADVGVWVQIAYGFTIKQIEDIDTGIARQLRDIAYMQGEAYSAQKCAVAGMVDLFLINVSRKQNSVIQEPIRAVLDEHVEAIMRVVPSKRIMAAPILMPLVVLRAVPEYRAGIDEFVRLSSDFFTRQRSNFAERGPIWHFNALAQEFQRNRGDGGIRLTKTRLVLNCILKYVTVGDVEYRNAHDSVVATAKFESILRQFQTLF